MAVVVGEHTKAVRLVTAEPCREFVRMAFGGAVGVVAVEEDETCDFCGNGGVSVEISKDKIAPGTVAGEGDFHTPCREFLPYCSNDARDAPMVGIMRLAPRGPGFFAAL